MGVCACVCGMHVCVHFLCEWVCVGAGRGGGGDKQSITIHFSQLS